VSYLAVDLGTTVNSDMILIYENTFIYESVFVGTATETFAG